MSNTNSNGRRTSARGTSLSSRALLARMNELLARVLMLLPRRSLDDIQTSALPVPLRNFLLMIPDIDFGVQWRLLAEEDAATEEGMDGNGDGTTSETGGDAEDSADYILTLRETAGSAPAQPAAHTGWGALRPDAGALRRQNALRRRRRFGAERARELHAELQAARSAIRHAPEFAGPLPLFSHHTHPLPARSAELRMDRFLSRARAGRLWTDTHGEPMERAPPRRAGRASGHKPNCEPSPDHNLEHKPDHNRDEEMHAPDDKRMPSANLHRNDRNLEPTASCDESTTGSPTRNTDTGCDSQRAPDHNSASQPAHHNGEGNSLIPPSQLQKLPGPTCDGFQENVPAGSGSNLKRVRDGQYRRRKRARVDGGGAGDVIDFSRLSAAARARILRGLDCSYMRSGLAFTLEAVPSYLPFPNPLPKQANVDMVFSHVGDTLDGFFSAATLYLAVPFLLYLCGEHSIGLGKRWAMVNEVVEAAVLQHSAGTTAMANALSAAVRILFSGHVVDFHAHDLRFLEGAGEGARRADLVRLQLQQWLQIRPMRHFGELFFLKYLDHAEHNLRDPKASVSDRQHAVVLGRNLKELMYDVTRGYDFVDRARVPFVAERAVRAEQLATEGRFRGARLPFAQEWDRRLCDRLVDYVTCTGPCLLNVQLNYVLFTVRVDVGAALDTLFHRFLPLGSLGAHREALRAGYARVKAGDGRCVLVCALNRKTGRLEVHNTRMALNLFYAQRNWAPNSSPVFLWEQPLDPWSNGDNNGDNDADATNNGSDSDDIDHSDPVVPDEYMEDSDDDIMPFRPYEQAFASATLLEPTTLGGWHKREVRDGFGFV